MKLSFSTSKRKYNLSIGTGVAETIKKELGLPMPQDSDKTFEIKGSNLITGIPTTLEIEAGEIREALNEPITRSYRGYKARA